jgi:hypothetical protein
MRATCSVEAEDSLGRVQRGSVEGVRAAAYRSGKVVGLVTDAQHKGDQALFGTREVELQSEADAERLYAFATDRDPDRLSIHSGVARPRIVTAVALLGLFVYAIVTRHRRRRGG